MITGEDLAEQTGGCILQAMTKPTIKILIADDQEIAREGTRHVLASQPDLEIVAVAADGLTAVQLAETHCPDVALLDIRMPHLTGIEAAQRIRAACPQVGLVLLSFYDDPRYARAFFKDGAMGKAFLLKQTLGQIEELVRAVRAVAAGQMMLDPTIVDSLLSDGGALTGLSDLTAQEMRVLALMAKGYANPAIAEALVVQERTIENYVSNIFAKLHLKDKVQQARVQAVLIFLEATGRLRRADEFPEE